MTSRNDDPTHHRRRAAVVVARVASAVFGVTALMALPAGAVLHREAAITVVVTYLAFVVLSFVLLRRNSRNSRLKVAHDVVDALAVGAFAALTGGTRSTVTFILYPHIVSISVRGRMRYVALMALLDAGIMGLLAWHTAGGLQGYVQAAALLWCAGMGASVSYHLRGVDSRLGAANRDLAATNEQLSATIAAGEITRIEQESAFKQLQSSEERYRHLLERIQDGVLIVQDGQVVYINNVFALIAGEPREALLGRDFREFVPPEDRHELDRRYNAWQKSQAVSGELELPLLRGDGSQRLVSLRAGSAEFEGHRAIITTVRDITRERQMEQDVRAHAERLAVVNEMANAINLSLTIDDILGVVANEARRLVPFEHLTLALLEDDRGGIDVVTVGRGAGRRTAALERDEALRFLRRPTSWSEASEQPRPRQAVELLGQTDFGAFASLPLFSKDRIIGSMNLGRMDGQSFSTWDLAVLEPVARHIAIALDNARLIEQVRQRGREFESLLDISRGIVERLELDDLLPLITRSVNDVMDTRNCVLMLRQENRLQMAAHEGLEPAVAEAMATLEIGESLAGWVAAHGTPLAVADMRHDARARFRHLSERHGYRSLLCVPLRHGDEILGTLEVVTRKVRRFTPAEQTLMSAFADQAAVAIVNARLFHEARANLVQVTESNRRLKELDQLRQEYLRNVSHEFRTPLTVMKGYAEYLRDSGPPGEVALKDVMRIMVESSDRVIDMVDTLLEVSRVEQDGAEQLLHLEKLDVTAIAISSIEPLHGTAEKRGVALRLEFPEVPLCMTGDTGLLEQVIRKLVDNALKYTAAGGQVTVRGQTRQDELVIEVTDTGIGIAAEHVPRIFDKFYMVDGGISRRVGGTGMGLYLVREIVRLHHGAVEVDSEPGSGSRFRVRLPVSLPVVSSLSRQAPA